MSNKHLMSNVGPGAKPVETHWYRVCVCDVCSHDACVNPLDNLWSLHLSCHSAKCHMSFSFAFRTIAFFLPPSTHCYTPISFQSFWSLYCFTLLLCHSDHSHSVHLSFFSLIFISAFLTSHSTSVSFNASPVVLAWRTISTPLVISDSGMCQASDFCDVNRPLILRLHRKTSQLYIGPQHRSFA